MQSTPPTQVTGLERVKKVLRYAELRYQLTARVEGLTKVEENELDGIPAQLGMKEPEILELAKEKGSVYC